MDMQYQQNLNKQIIANSKKLATVECESFDDSLILLQVGAYVRLASITEDFKNRKSYWVGKEEFSSVESAIKWVKRFV